MGTQEEEDSGGGEVNEGGEEHGPEDKNGLFKNDTVKSVCADYSPVMRGEKCERGHGGGDADGGGEGESEVFESTILSLS